MSALAPVIRDSDFEPAFPQNVRPRQTSNEQSQDEPGTLAKTGAATGYRLRVSDGMPASRVQIPLPLDQRAKTVEGVVLTVDTESVSVRCRLPNKFVELTLPRVFLPEDLAHYGAAVTLEVDQDSPFRRLKIQARQVVETADTELAEIDEWIDKLGEDQPRNK